MAITVVQEKILTGSGASASGSMTTTAGNALVACVHSFNNSGAITGSGGGTWTSDASGSFNAGIDSLAILSCPNNSGGTLSLTFSATGASGVVAIVYEVSGLPSSSIRDATSPAVKTGTGTAASTNSLSNVTANAIFIGMVGDTDGSASSTVNGTAAGWTYPTGAQEKNGSSFNVTGTGYDIVSSTGSQSSTWTITSSTWGALIAVYKGASGGGATVTQLLASLGCGA